MDVGTLRGLLIPGVLVLLSGGRLVNLVRTMRAARGVPTWPTTAGIVTFSGAELEGNRYRPSLLYRYTVAGRPYSAARRSLLAERATRDEDRALVRSADYPRDATVTVHYNPANPAEAVLDPTPPPLAVYALQGVVALGWLLGSAAVCVLLLAIRDR